MQQQHYLIETGGLSRRFGPQVAVDDLNLLVPAAGVYGFLGPIVWTSFIWHSRNVRSKTSF